MKRAKGEPIVGSLPFEQGVFNFRPRGYQDAPTVEAALPYYIRLIRAHHKSTMEGDAQRICDLRDDAQQLACYLNGGTCMGICTPTGPATLLEEATAVHRVPLWGQEGNFRVRMIGIPIAVKLEGLFGIGIFEADYPGFEVRAVDANLPFVSETGYRSFIGAGRRRLQPGLTPQAYVLRCLEEYLEGPMKGRLLRIEVGDRPWFERKKAS